MHKSPRLPGICATRISPTTWIPTLCLASALTWALVGCEKHELYTGQPAHVERRHLKLEGAQNFRDLGGYPTIEGSSVRWGLFYRSDNLASLTDADLERVSELGLKLVCDFRGSEEKADAPDRLPDSNPPAIAELEIFDASFSSANLRARITSGELADFDARRFLIRANRKFVTQFVDRYARMFERLIKEENLPAVVHCTAGKDRAGLASALILRTLGVPIETIYEDFLLTNHYTANQIERVSMMMGVVSLFGMDPDQFRPLLSVERAFLEAAFETIDEHHGTFDAFRRNALGIDDFELAAFREMALETDGG
jgi:protein-tyrosine phosphatase